MYALDVVTKSIFCYGIDIQETLRKLLVLCPKDHVGDDKTIRISHYVALIVMVPRGCRLVSMHVTLQAHVEPPPSTSNHVD
jgi:hypothetical protein